MKKEKRKRESRVSVLERAAEMFDLPGEVVAGVTRLTVTGGSRVYVENHRGILDYGLECISISGGKCIIKLRGRGLCLKSMSESELLVTGTILGIDYEY